MSHRNNLLFLKSSKHQKTDDCLVHLNHTSFVADLLLDTGCCIFCPMFRPKAQNVQKSVQVI